MKDNMVVKNSVGLQTVLPEDYENNIEFNVKLETLKNLGCSHVELNIAEPMSIDGNRVKQFLGQYDISFTNFATGGLYPDKTLSLSHEDKSVRGKTIEILKNVIEFCESIGIEGVILGLIQGNSCKDRKLARQYVREALEVLTPVAENANVKLIVESTNRYLTNVANTLEDTYELVVPFPEDVVRILPDTFHMNIEERDMYTALRSFITRYDSIHFSENNRYYPGYGAVDFKRVYKSLSEAGFAGTITVEGNIYKSFNDDMEIAVGEIEKAMTC